MSLDIQGDDGILYDGNQGYDYHLMPGTTGMSWNFTDLIEDTSTSSTGTSTASTTASQTRTPSSPLTPTWHTSTSRLRERPGRCRRPDDRPVPMRHQPIRRTSPLSVYTNSYERVEDFSFYPQEPCYPPFDVLATDSSANLTVDALHPDFVLEAGENHLFIDFSGMGNNTEWRLEWYYYDGDDGHGWYYDDISVDTSDDIPDGIHFNMTLDFWECNPYIDARVYNTTDGQWDQIYSSARYFQGPCLKPVTLLIEGEDALEMDDMRLPLGTTNMTWSVDHLVIGVDYRLEWYYSNDSHGTAGTTSTSPTTARTTSLVHVSTSTATPRLRYLYYDDNGSIGNSEAGTSVPDCANVGSRSSTRTASTRTATTSRRVEQPLVGHTRPAGGLRLRRRDAGVRNGYLRSTTTCSPTRAGTSRSTSPRIGPGSAT